MEKITLNTEVTTTKVKQEANAILNTIEKTLYYLIIKNKAGVQMVINVGEKTHNLIVELTKEEIKK